MIRSQLDQLAIIRSGTTGRVSSWDTSGRNTDRWTLDPGESWVLADIDGPGQITNIWMTQPKHYRECLLKFTWDNARHPSIVCPLGDFFGLGHNNVNSYQSHLFTASARTDNQFNSYAPMPFRERAVVELVNESAEPHIQYFYVDYEALEDHPDDNLGYFHAEFRRENPFGGWGHEITVNVPESNIVHKERMAWDNNYVILETKGRGHYIGCNLSVTNSQGDWWGEGDDMIWVDGYKWPPDLHGTGSEDYLNQAYGTQDNAFLRNGSSIHEDNTAGYQTSYVHHTENPVRFDREIKVTIEHGHANHLANEMSSVADWYAEAPTKVAKVPAVSKRMPVKRDNRGEWLHEKKGHITSRQVELNREMRESKKKFGKQ